jgi:hypothetical protein
MYFAETPCMPKFSVNIEKYGPMVIPTSLAISCIVTVKLNAPGH